MYHTQKIKIQYYQYLLCANIYELFTKNQQMEVKQYKYSLWPYTGPLYKGMRVSIVIIFCENAVVLEVSLDGSYFLAFKFTVMLICTKNSKVL